VVIRLRGYTIERDKEVKNAADEREYEVYDFRVNDGVKHKHHKPIISLGILLSRRVNESGYLNNSR